MDGNVVFGNEKTQQAPPPPQEQSVPSPAINTPPPTSPPISTEPPAMPPPETPARSGIVGLLLKIGIPLIVLIILIFLVVKFVLPLFHAGGNGQAVTITYWGLWEPKAVMQPIIDEFQKQNPMIKVVYEQRDIKRHRDSLVTRINNGDGPDVFRFHNSWTRTMQNTLAPLPSSVISPDEFKKQYFPVVQSDMTIQGALYGIPIHMDTLALFVNDAILADNGIAAPQTWEDFTKAVASVTVRDEAGQTHTAGAAIGSYDNILHAPDILSALFAQSRIDLKNPVKASPQSFVEPMRFYTDFATGRDNIEKVWDKSREPSLDAFAGGNVAFYFGYSWDVFTIKAKNPQLTFSIHPMPFLTKPVTVASYWAEGVSKKSKHQKEAMLFLAFLTKKETQQRLYSEESKTRLFGELPARRDLADLLKENTLAYPFVSQAETAVSSYFVSDTYDAALNDQLNGYLGNAIRSILGNTSAESAADTLTKGIAQVLSRYGIK